MFEDQDLKKAAQLKELGYYSDMDIIELAKLIYSKRTVRD
jgi:hypothetical protein